MTFCITRLNTGGSLNSIGSLSKSSQQAVGGFGVLSGSPLQFAVRNANQSPAFSSRRLQSSCIATIAFPRKRWQQGISDTPIRQADPLVRFMRKSEKLSRNHQSHLRPARPANTSPHHFHVPQCFAFRATVSNFGLTS